MALKFFSQPLGIGPNDRGPVILSGYLSHYASACTWVWTHVLYAPRQAVTKNPQHQKRQYRKDKEGEV